MISKKSVTECYAVVPELGGPGGPLAPPIFGRSVNPIPTGEGRLSPPITIGTPNVFHLPASLNRIVWNRCQYYPVLINIDQNAGCDRYSWI